MTAYLVHVFSKNDAEVPYASYWVSNVKGGPRFADEVALPTDDNEWKPIIGTVSFARWHAGLRTREVGVVVAESDEDLVRLAQRLAWMRHRRAES